MATVRSRAFDGSGAALAGVTVTFVWDLPGGPRADREVTDWRGEAVAEVSLADVAAGTAVTVDVLAEYNGQSKERSTTLVVE